MESEPNSPDRLALEQLWLSKLKKAQERYKTALAHYRDVLDRRRRDLLMPADASLVVNQAHLEETAALAEYLLVMREYTDLVVSGKVPKRD